LSNKQKNGQDLFGVIPLTFGLDMSDPDFSKEMHWFVRYFNFVNYSTNLIKNGSYTSQNEIEMAKLIAEAEKMIINEQKKPIRMENQGRLPVVSQAPKTKKADTHQPMETPKALPTSASTQPGDPEALPPHQPSDQTLPIVKEG